MNRKDSLWLLKTSSGKIRGPLSTNAILQIISDGALTGDEEIALVPDGEWLPISTEPDFYEKLLEAMEAEAQASESQINRKAAGGARSNDKHFAATVIKPPTPGKQDDTEQTRSIVIPLKPKIDEVSQSSNPFAKTPPPTNSNVRERKDTHSEPVLELHTASQVRNYKPLQIGLILIVIAVFAYLFLEEETESPQSRVSLLLPSPGKVQLSENEAKVVLQKALRLMERSNGDDLIQAQNIIASVVEGSSNNLEARGLLCFLYKEIWPYTAMDSGQLKIAQMFTQQTRSLNLVSPYGNYCEAVNLFLNDRTRETKGVLDGILETDPRFSMLPVVYLFKGEVLQQEQDWATSLAFTEKASELWPEWVLPRVVIGRTQYLKGNRAEAYKAFQNALIRGPTHVESLLYTAVILFSDYKRNDEAKQIFDRQLGIYKENLERLYVPKTIKAEAMYSYAQILLQLGQSDAAIPFARAALKIYPSVGRYRDLIARLGEAESISEKDRGSELLALGDQYAKKGDCLTAQAEYKSVFEADPRNSMAAVKAAQCLWKLNQGHEALTWLNKATQADPRNILAYTLKADYLSKRYDFESAIRAINTAQSLDANNHDLLKAMGIVERRRKNLPAALTYLGKAVKSYEGDIQALAEISQAYLESSQMTVPSGKKEIERKEQYLREAIKYATKAVEIDSTNVEGQIAYAKTIAASGGTDAAVEHLRALITKFSHSLEYRVALGNLLRSEERFAQAEEIFFQVSESDPKNKEAWYGLGDSRHQLQKLEPALVAFLKAAVLDPTDAEPVYQTGLIYSELGRNEDAIQQFKRVQRINPHFPRTYYQIGRVSLRMGDLKTAQEAAEQEMKLNPNLADSYILLAEIHMARKRFADCASSYAQAIKLRPGSAEIYVRAADCYWRSGALSVAENMLELASARESGYAEIYRVQGQIYVAKSDFQSALVAFEKYLELSPNAPDRKEIEAEINRYSR